jgi:acyl-CoA synthetase (AMP-forming)/AMP-acid ligase II
MNIVEPILFQARHQPGAPALCAPGHDAISYERLAAQMNIIARRASSVGLVGGNVVALSLDEPLLHAAFILGLTQVGIIPVSVADHKPPDGLAVDAVISSRPYPFTAEARHFLFDASWTIGDDAPVQIHPCGSLASDLACRIVLTSGTNGDPKAVALTHRMVMARNARFEYIFGNRFPAYSRIYIDLGLAAALGYQFLTCMLARGGTIFFPGGDTEATLRTFEIFRIEAMLTTPAMLGHFLTACDQHSSIGVHLDTIVSSGSLMPGTLVDRARPRICAHLVTGYGATETAMSATAPAQRIANIPGAAGYVTPGMRIEIVDDIDRPLPPGKEGIVRVSSEFGIAAYVDDPAESAKVFRQGWFYPGDLGSLTGEHLLVISGRQHDVLNAGGGKMPAEKLEAALISYAGVREAAAFMVTNKHGIDEVWAAIVCKGKVDTEGLLSHCRHLMPAVFVPSNLIAIDTLPTNATGKIDRRKLKASLTSAGAS